MNKTHLVVLVRHVSSKERRGLDSLKIQLTCVTIHFVIVVVVVKIQTHSNQSLCMEFNKKSYPKTDYC